MTSINLKPDRRFKMYYFIGILVFLFSFSTYSKVPEKVDVVIVGAGLSGLATAYELKKQGISYHILELTPRIGGRVRTVKYQFGGEELVADAGMEEYWDSNPAVEVLKELKLPLLSDVAQSSIVLNKKIEPLGTEDKAEFLSKILTPAGFKALKDFEKKVAPVVSEVKARKVSSKNLSLKNLSFAQFVKSHKLPLKVSEWIRVTIECETGTEWEKVSALDGLEEYSIFIGEGEKLHRAINGNENFTENFAKVIGVENITTNRRVNRIVAVPELSQDGKATKYNNKVKVFYLDTEKNKNSSIEAFHVVSTAPLFRLFEIQFEPALSPKKRQAIQTQSWGSYFKAHVFLPSKVSSYWTKNDLSILPILSDSELGVIYDGNPSQKTKTKILSLLISGKHAETFNMMPLDLVRPQIQSSLEKIFPGIKKEILGMEFYRYHPRAIASWPVGRSRFDELSEEVRRPENHVYLAGDFTESSHSDGAFISAKRVVNQIIQSSKVAVGAAR